MKKDTILGFLALIVLVFALRTLAMEPEVEVQNYENNEINCKECCKQGRWASSDCCRNCGGCEAYSDEGKAECQDFPD